MNSRLPSYLLGLGVFLAITVALEVGGALAAGEELELVYFVFLLSSVPFHATIIVGGLWLRRGGVPPARYRRIGGWTLSGIAFWGGLFLLVGLLMMSAVETYGAVRWGVTVGAGLGLLVGVFEARAIEGVRRAEQRQVRARELEIRKERLEEFASIVSHDLRNPLTVAMGRLDLAQSEHESEHLDAIDRALSRMEVILDNTLELARQGVVISEPESVELGELARAAWANVDTEDATLHLDGTMDLTADRERLLQVFENLFRNAIEHAGTDVDVRVGPLAQERGFYLEDNGPGIPPEQREDIFQPGTSAKTDGTGFGLAIVRSIVTAHDWEVEVVDSEAGGARFEFVMAPYQRGGAEKPSEMPYVLAQ